MARRKIFTFFLLIIAVLILYFILTAKSVIKPLDFSRLNLGQQAKNVKTALLAADYQARAKELLAAYEKLAKGHELTSARAKELKDQLLNLKVPAEFKELHVNFVLALTKLEDSLGGKVESGQDIGQQLINQLKANYSWLNK